MQWVVYWVYPHRHHQIHMSNEFQLNIIIASLLLRDRNFSATLQPHGIILLHAIHYCSKGNFAVLPKSLWLESTLESAFLKKEVWSPANRQCESHMGATWVHEWILGGCMLELDLCCVLSQKQMNKYSSISLGLILGSQPHWLWLYTIKKVLVFQQSCGCIWNNLLQLHTAGILIRESFLTETQQLSSKRYTAFCFWYLFLHKCPL